MKVFEFISSDCYLFSWNGKGCLLNRQQAWNHATALAILGLITIDEFPA
jgi:hypothetical protein